jgi:hypothetical protein
MADLHFQVGRGGWPITSAQGFSVLVPEGWVVRTFSYPQMPIDGWPVGTKPPVLPDDFSRLVMERGLTPPLGAQPYTQQSYDAMRQSGIPAEQIVTHPGLDGISRW